MIMYPAFSHRQVVAHSFAPECYFALGKNVWNTGASLNWRSRIFGGSEYRFGSTITELSQRMPYVLAICVIG